MNKFICLFWCIFSFASKIDNPLIYETLDLLVKKGVEYPGKVIVVMILETDYMYKPLAKNNYLNMHKPIYRETLCEDYLHGDNSKLCVYKSIHEAIDDYILWEKHVLSRYKNLNEENYYLFLEEVGFCEKKGYHIKLQKLEDSILKKLINNYTPCNI